MKDIPFSVVFLAGGSGQRMEKSIPKQYIPIHGKPLALYSFEVFVSIPEVQEIIVVCEPHYDSLFQEHVKAKELNLQFARPGCGERF